MKADKLHQPPEILPARPTQILKPALAEVVGAERFLAEIRTTANQPAVSPVGRDMGWKVPHFSR